MSIATLLARVSMKFSYELEELMKDFQFSLCGSRCTYFCIYENKVTLEADELSENHPACYEDITKYVCNNIELIESNLRFSGSNQKFESCMDDESAEECAAISIALPELWISLYNHGEGYNSTIILSIYEEISAADDANTERLYLLCKDVLGNEIAKIY